MMRSEARWGPAGRGSGKRTWTWTGRLGETDGRGNDGKLELNCCTAAVETNDKLKTGEKRGRDKGPGAWIRLGGRG